MKQPACVDVLGIPIHALNMQQTLDCIASDLQHSHRGYVCVTGVHGIMEAQRDSALPSLYHDACLVVPDGMPTVWVGRINGYKHMQRVAGPDLMLEVLGNPMFRGRRHFFFGGKPGVAERLRDEMQQRFPGVSIVGTYTPPFGPLSLLEEEELIATVKKARPDILWVGLSTPKQERFMAKYINRLDTTLMFGVGAAFDYHTGSIKDSPQWVKKIGMQWLHRLAQDPKRLWRRYLRNNPQFVARITLQLLRSHFKEAPIKNLSSRSAECHSQPSASLPQQRNISSTR